LADDFVQRIVAVNVAPGAGEDDYAELQLIALESVLTAATGSRTQSF
jgi:hypothetical protein